MALLLAAAHLLPILEASVTDLDQAPLASYLVVASDLVASDLVASEPDLVFVASLLDLYLVALVLDL